MLARMKRKASQNKKLKLIKTTISLPEVLVDWAEDRCALDGHNSFSAYIASLIREERDGTLKEMSEVSPTEQPAPGTKTSYSSRPDHGLILNEKPSAAKKPRAA